MRRLARWFDTARVIARLHDEKNAWRDKAVAAVHAERELAQMCMALRRRLDVLEQRPGVTAANVKLAHDLEQAQAGLAEARTAHRDACRLLARYANTFGPLVDVNEGAA